MDDILVSVNNTVTESTGVLQDVRQTLQGVHGFFSFIEQNSGLLKLAGFILGGLTMFLLLMAGIVLFRMAFGI